MISITVERLVKKFGDTVALGDVSLSNQPGELFFLLGASGCGKTTLLRSIAGFVAPDGGRILFGDDDVTRLPVHKRNAGMMFQSYALWPHLTVAENVAFGLEERRLKRAEIQSRVEQSLAAVQMAAYGARKISQLSGGQQQRVALARALVVRPRALLLDEPLSNLDAKLRLDMRNSIRAICKESGLTAIYVTHDQKEALSIADRMAVLEGGVIAQVGTPEEVYRRPWSRGVADFIGETNFIPGTLIAGSSERVLVETAGGKFEGVPGDPGAAIPLGAAVDLSIRPECWRLERERPAANALPGTIGESIYLGEIAQYRFLSSGAALKIFELNPRPGARNTSGVWYAAADPRDVVVLKR